MNNSKKISKVLICGGRHFDDYEYLNTFCESVLKGLDLADDVEIVSGHCKGADMLGERFAKEHGYGVKTFPAQWDKYGKGAGLKRNIEMLDYMKDYGSVVIGFVSENSKGTKFTVNNAKKRMIETYVTECQFDETFGHLYEGVQKKNGTFQFDFNKDNPGDFIKFKRTVRKSSLNNTVYYFGYRVTRDENNVLDVKEFLHYIKSEKGLNDTGVQQMLTKCEEDFVNSTSSDSFDCIIKAPSSSQLNTRVSEDLSKMFGDIPVFDCAKKPAVELDFDWDKIRHDTAKKGEEYFNSVKDYLTSRYLNKKRGTEYFNISKIMPQFRKWVRPMVRLVDTELDLTQFKNILIVDDTVTTGSTIAMMLAMAREYDPEINLTVFSVLNNRS